VIVQCPAESFRARMDRVPLPVLDSPTAMQDWVLTQEIPVSVLVPGAFGLGTTDQLVPFHRSIRVPALPAELPVTPAVPAQREDPVHLLVARRIRPGSG
jgi:hypothetical protein